jgi:hypothetical protein
VLGSVVVLATTVGVPRVARADLHVERSGGADSCPDAASFASRLRDGSEEQPADSRDIDVRFERTEKGYHASIIMPNGVHRSLADDASSCDALAEATLLAVRLALDVLDVPANEAAPSPSPSPPIPAVSTLSPLSPAAPAEVAAPPPDVRRSPFAEISASGVLMFGIGSPVAPGVRAGGALTVGAGRWSIGLTGLVLPAHSRDIGDGSVDVSVFGGGIEGCRQARIGRTILVALCGRLEAMALEGSSRGFARVENHAVPLFAGTLLGRARMTVAGPVSLFAEAGAEIPFLRQRFSIDTIGVVYDPPIVAAATGIGVLVDFE